MFKTIEIPLALYDRLAKHARGFDTPANVVEMLLDSFERSRPKLSDGPPTLPTSRKYEKYVFEGKEYGKGRLVLAIITAHVKAHPAITSNDLLKTFPKRLQGSSRGVFDPKEKAMEAFNREGRKRHFLDENELLQLSDGVVAVSTQWGVNTDNFIDHARSLGYKIEPATGTV
jgi:hypothetical protein